MKKEIVTVDEARGIARVTTEDSRWYGRLETSPVTGLPEYIYRPSVTWIASYYPKGVAYYKWLAQHGWDEAESIKRESSDRGSVIHQGISILLSGKAVAYRQEFYAPEIQAPREITTDEYAALMTFGDWWGSLKSPRVIAQDLVLWGADAAGTLDLFIEADGVVTLIDAKSGQHVFAPMEIQLTKYRDLLPAEIIPELADVNLAILQVGYRANQRGWKLTPVEYQPELYDAARVIWAKETSGQSPATRDYPLSIDLSKPRSAPKTRRKLA